MKTYISIIFCFFSYIYYTQEIKQDTLLLKNQTVQDIESDIEKYNKKIAPPNNPTKAGVRSAILPGLGQYYNRKYWKIPIVWGGIGTGLGITLWNQKQYKRYHSAFIAELSGLPHEFSDIAGVDKNVLGRTQDRAKRQRDYAIAITGLVYILNIVDAVVDAHLYDQKRDPDLVLQPTILYDEYTPQTAKAGLSLSFRF